jgi:hypothetical protein
MSELSGIERQQEAPTMRERAAGPLLPRWFTTLFYAVFVPFCIFSVYDVVRSLRIQHALTGAIGTLLGNVAADAVSPDSEAGRKAMAVLQGRSLDSFLYLNQTLLQDPEQDDRMARALALRRAVDWGTVSAQRQVIGDVVAHMKDDGSVASDFVMAPSAVQTLDEMVQQRRAQPDLTFVEDRITDVLAWLAAGHPGQPKGTERKQLMALQKEYAKKFFAGAEAAALRALAADWQGDPDKVRQEAAAAFDQMLQGKSSSLSPEAQAMCSAAANDWESRYRDGVMDVAKASREMVADIVKKDVFLDHPHVYQYLGLLDYPYKEVRDQVVEGAWLLRHDRFTIRFLAYFGTKTTFNPFMAVETLRLTREEHERALRVANQRRMGEAVALLGRIGVDYIEHADAYAKLGKDADDYVRRFIIAALREVAEEPAIGPEAKKALAEMQAAVAAGPGRPDLFKSSAE